MDIKGHLDFLSKLGVIAWLVVILVKQVRDRFHEGFLFVLGQMFWVLIDAFNDTFGNPALTALPAGTAVVSNSTDRHSGSVRKLVCGFTVGTVGCVQTIGCSDVQFFADLRDRGW